MKQMIGCMLLLAIGSGVVVAEEEAAPKVRDVNAIRMDIRAADVLRKDVDGKLWRLKASKRNMPEASAERSACEMMNRFAREKSRSESAIVELKQKLADATSERNAMVSAKVDVDPVAAGLKSEKRKLVNARTALEYEKSILYTRMTNRYSPVARQLAADKELAAMMKNLPRNRQGSQEWMEYDKRKKERLAAIPEAKDLQAKTAGIAAKISDIGRQIGEHDRKIKDLTRKVEMEKGGDIEALGKKVYSLRIKVQTKQAELSDPSGSDDAKCAKISSALENLKAAEAAKKVANVALRAAIADASLADLTKLRSDADSVMDKKIAALLAEDEDGAAKLKERAEISGRIEALNTELKAKQKKDADDKKAKAKRKKDADDKKAKAKRKKDSDDKKAKANRKKQDEIRAKIEALNTELKAFQ